MPWLPGEVNRRGEFLSMSWYGPSSGFRRREAVECRCACMAAVIAGGRRRLDQLPAGIGQSLGFGRRSLMPGVPPGGRRARRAPAPGSTARNRVPWNEVDAGHIPTPAVTVLRSQGSTASAAPHQSRALAPQGTVGNGASGMEMTSHAQPATNLRLRSGGVSRAMSRTMTLAISPPTSSRRPGRRTAVHLTGDPCPAAAAHRHAYTACGLPDPATSHRREAARTRPGISNHGRHRPLRVSRAFDADRLPRPFRSRSACGGA